MGIKIFDTNLEDDDDAITAGPFNLVRDNVRNLTFQVRVNGSGTKDLVGAWTVGASSDPLVEVDARDGTSTAYWTDISSTLTIPAANNGQDEGGLINIASPGFNWVRLTFTPSSGTDGSVEAWYSFVSAGP